MTQAATQEDERTRAHRRIVRQPDPRAVHAVERVFAELGIESLAEIDVALIGAHYGLVPVVRDLENEEAHLLRAGSRGIVAIARRAWEGGWWRFPFAHELGHWLLDEPDHDDLPRCTSSRPTRARRRVESAVSDFAGLLLVPEAFARARWDLRAPGLALVRAIAAASRVSVEVAALRVLQMTEAPRAVVVSCAGLVQWWAETAAFGARVRAGRVVPEGSAAATLHAERREREGAAESWDGRRVEGSAVKVAGVGDVVVSWLG